MEGRVLATQVSRLDAEFDPDAMEVNKYVLTKTLNQFNNIKPFYLKKYMFQSIVQRSGL